MDRTADSLFGTSGDDGLDFLNLQTSPEPPAAAQHEPHPEAPTAATSTEYTTTDNETPASTNGAGYDPYSQLKGISTLRQTSQAGTRDPYAPTSNEHHLSGSPHASLPSASSTYVPANDPYANVAPASKPKHDPYAPSPYSTSTNPYSPPAASHSSLPPTTHPSSNTYPSPFIPSTTFTPPAPPAPKVTDVSKYRQAPNAYDPPIKNKSTSVARGQSMGSGYASTPLHQQPSAMPGMGIRQQPPPPQHQASYGPPPGQQRPPYTTVGSHPSPHQYQAPPPSSAYVTPPPSAPAGYPYVTPTHAPPATVPPPLRATPPPPRAAPPPQPAKQSLSRSSTLSPGPPPIGSVPGSRSSLGPGSIHGTLPRASSPLAQRPPVTSTPPPPRTQPIGRTAASPPRANIIATPPRAQPVSPPKQGPMSPSKQGPVSPPRPTSCSSNLSYGRTQGPHSRPGSAASIGSRETPLQHMQSPPRSYSALLSSHPESLGAVEEVAQNGQTPESGGTEESTTRQVPASSRREVGPREDDSASLDGDFSKQRRDPGSMKAGMEDEFLKPADGVKPDDSLWATDDPALAARSGESYLSDPYAASHTSDETWRVEELKEEKESDVAEKYRKSPDLKRGEGEGLEPYPPMETDEIVENLKEHRRAPVDLAETPTDPYAIPITRTDPYAPVMSDRYAPPVHVADPYGPAKATGPHTSPQNPSDPYASPSHVPIRSSVPPPRANVAPPPANKAPPLNKDPYAPPISNPYSPPASHAPPANVYTPVGQPQAPPGLAPTSGGVIDLSHSPPATRAVPPYVAPLGSVGSRRSTMESEGYSPYSPVATKPYAPQSTLPVEPPTGPGSAQYIPAAATGGTYAPSPSLLGTNDPLGRASVRAPIFSFGFGGRVVACFHNNPGMGAFDGMAPARPSTTLSVKVLKEVIPVSAYDVNQHGFPGPLHGDIGSGGGVLQTAAQVTKGKKASLIGWLDARIKEAEEGSAYLAGQEGARVEGKVVLMKLLKVIVENDGKLSGIPDVEEAVRNALLGSAELATTGMVPGFQMPAMGYPGQGATSSTVASYSVSSSALDHIQELLLRGERKLAYRYALDQRLWAHALVIASSIDKESWKEACHEFTKTELKSLEGKEALKVAYGLFAGDGPGAIKLLVPPTTFGLPGAQAHSRFSSAASLDPNSPISEATTVPEQTWAQWKKLLASTIANSPPGDTTSITALGDYLLVNNWIYAAHCCYLLSPNTSIFSGVGAPGMRNVLFGSADPSISPAFHTSLEPILFSEIVEFAKSLIPTVKGQEVFHGFPHLQAYRLWHAVCLAEMGEVVLAKKYTDAINATIRSMTKPSPYYTTTFLEQLEELHDRLVEAPHADKTKAWITKPTVRSFNDWITGGLEKLIQGDEMPQKDESVDGKKSLEVAGPFSHYSAIASTTPSAQPSPNSSYTNLHTASVVARSGSATGYRPPAHSITLPVPPPPRAASAIEPSKGRASPSGPKPPSASVTSSSLSNPYQPVPPAAENNGEEETSKPLYAQWWSDGNDDGVTPTASSFENALEKDSGNFVSLMDNEPTLMPPASTTSSSGGHRDERVFDDEEDLGFGNSKKRKEDHEDTVATSEESAGSSPVTAKPEPSKPPASVAAQATQASAVPAKGWFSWLRRDSTPKPPVANLGEENAFYFDKELGKWVNKRAGAEATAPKVPPPPPARAQTASPGHSGLAAKTATPPPPRAASAMPGSNLAPPPRPSSTLSSASADYPSSISDSVPSRTSSVPPPPQGGPMPTRGLGQTPPPPPSSASPAGSTSGRASAKRSARSRYVDVFQATSGSEA